MEYFTPFVAFVSVQKIDCRHRFEITEAFRHKQLATYQSEPGFFRRFDGLRQNRRRRSLNPRSNSHPSPRAACRARAHLLETHARPSPTGISDSSHLSRHSPLINAAKFLRVAARWLPEGHLEDLSQVDLLAFVVIAVQHLAKQGVVEVDALPRALGSLTAV